MSINSSTNLSAQLKAGCITILAVLLGLESNSAQPPRTIDLKLPTDWATAIDFQRAADRWISVTILNETNTLRQVCYDLSRTQAVSIVLDRRLDPHAAVLLEPPVAGAFTHVLEQVAACQQAEIREIGNAFMLIPEHRAEPFTTLLALRREEFVQLAERPRPGSAANQPFRFEDTKQIQKILEPTRQRWDNFQSPRQLLIEKTEAAGLIINNATVIPHDLWAAGELPQANLLELLTFVLFQYESTYEWISSAEIRIKPISAPLQIARRYRINQKRIQELETELQIKFPDSGWKRFESELEVTGPEDLHLAIKTILDPPRQPTGTEQAEWKSRHFTMRVQRKTVQEILEYLQQSGLPVRYDLTALKKAGHPVETSISFELTSGSIEELLNAICQPIRLPYRLTEQEIQIGR